MTSSRFTHFVGASSLVALAAASIIPDLHLLGASRTRLAKRDVWPYAVIGDSWGSGVSWKKDVLYDDNLDKCLRTKESHGPQMEADTSWLGGFTSGLRDAACSGSQFVDLAKGSHQMGKVGQPDVVVMTSGGNNAGFGHIVDVCIYHADPNHNYGPAYKDDHDGTGDCAVALKDASNYINNVMQQDLINTIQDILDDPNVKNNQKFLLYVTGYAQFFGTDYDPWCNNEYWNIPNLRFTPTPYLSVELRTAFNDRVSAVNTLYKNTIAAKYADKARYIDLDAGFSGHRFCEPGANHGDQVNKDTNFGGVYLWNLNYPINLLNFPLPINLGNILDGQFSDSVTAQQAEQLFNGQGVTAWSGSGQGGNEASNGWRLRPFHPRTSGYTSIKDAILAQLKRDGFPKAPSSNPSSAPPNYAPGTCSFHLDEVQDCNADSSNLYAHIKMFDNSKAVIGETNVDNTKNPHGDPINTSAPLNFQSKLPFPLQVTGEHQNDYVQFNYNGLNFASGDGQCSVGGWDPKQGPSCGAGLFGGPHKPAVSPACLSRAFADVLKFVFRRVKANSIYSIVKWIVHSHARQEVSHAFGRSNFNPLNPHFLIGRIGCPAYLFGISHGAWSIGCSSAHVILVFRDHTASAWPALKASSHLPHRHTILILPSNHVTTIALNSCHLEVHIADFDSICSCEGCNSTAGTQRLLSYSHPFISI